MKKYVIIGNGVASTGCIEGIRSIDPQSHITVVSEERHPVYCRPLISYYLEGKTDTEKMRYRDPDFYDKMGCEVLYGRKAVHLDTGSHSVVLDDGGSLEYDALCLATGSSPFIPPYEGLDTIERVFTFTTLDDALALEQAVTDSSRVLISGAGLIGLKCAEGLSGRAGSITVCNRSNRILSSILDDESSAFVQRHMEKNGIKFCLGNTISRFDGNRAVMQNGEAIDFDILVIALGVRANTSLLEEAGGRTARGIITDDRMETSVNGIYAAGDCTETMDISSGTSKVIAIMPNAYMQGHAAGVNMAGGSEVFNKGIPMNAIGFFGLHIMTAGTYEGAVYEEKTDSSFKKLFTGDDLLKGFILIGLEERAGIYTSMIREKTPLSSVNFDILRKTATTAALRQEQRRKTFGGVV